MTSIQSRLEQIGTELAKITTDTYHYWRSAPKGVKSYIVWAEDEESSSLEADNKKQKQGLHGTIDYFTKAEFDENVDKIQVALNDLENVSFRLNSVQYEEETTFIHHEWEFWVR